MIKIPKEDMLNDSYGSAYMNAKHITSIRSYVQRTGHVELLIYCGTDEPYTYVLKPGCGWEEDGLKFLSIVAQVDKLNGELDE